MRIRCLGVAASILSALAPATAATADTIEHPLCVLILHQERVELEERELAVDLALSRSNAEESIFALVDALWKDDLIERIGYLTAKHNKDVAVIHVKRRELLLKRQDALIEQLASICPPSGDREIEVDRGARREDAHRRYLQADCHRIGKDLAIAEVDLAYLTEFLANVKDLRENDVATRQEVIRAEEQVELARKRVEHQVPRVQACSDTGATAGNAAP